jgi:nucleoside-diphosphate-sugar epimerase
MSQQFEPAAVIPPGSLILVTGVNGFLGCRFANTLIERGYRVRGVVRQLERCTHVSAFFEQKFGNDGRFEMVQVTDPTSNGAFDAAVKGRSIALHNMMRINLKLHRMRRLCAFCCR